MAAPFLGPNCPLQEHKQNKKTLCDDYLNFSLSISNEVSVAKLSRYV